MDVEARLALLEEAHVGHRKELRDLRADLASLRALLGIDDKAVTMGPGGARTIDRRLRHLENGGLSWTTSEAKQAVEKLTQLADEMQRIFGSDPNA